MIIGMNVDYKKLTSIPLAVENAELIAEEVGAPTVNVDANFTVPEEFRYQDGLFPRLTHMKRIVDAFEERGGDFSKAVVGHLNLHERPHRRPDIADEWKLLKKSWSLARRDKEKLSKKILSEASKKYYGSEPLTDLQDWIWRFTLFLTAPGYEDKFLAVIDSIKKTTKLVGFADFQKAYDAELSADRATMYFNLLRDFFSAFSEFSQVYFVVSAGLDVEEGTAASSGGFESTKMFYGNAFEVFSSLVDVLAYMNNIDNGRKFDEFEKLTRKQYLELDKSSRFNTFSLNEAFMGLCVENDNQLRNASHHGAFRFDQSAQIINYRAGKGGKGELRQISYAAYLERCTRIFLQAMTLLRAEILMCHHTGGRPPI